MAKRTRKGEHVVKDVFGATLADYGRGFYVCLELLALVRGTFESSGEVLPSDRSEPLVIKRRSHDYIRRLMANESRLSERELAELGEGTTFETLKALALGLKVPIAGRRGPTKWIGDHIYPFVGELIHYDAAERKIRAADDDPKELGFRISMERYAMRGAGGLAHRILRDDPDEDRLSQVRAGMQKIVSDSGTPLGSLFGCLGKRDAGVEPDGFKENTEHGVVVMDSRWVDVLRNGVRNILLRELPTAKQVEALMHWVPYCVARHQEDLAYQSLGQAAPPIPVECGGDGGPVRRAARRAADLSKATIVNCLEEKAKVSEPSLVAPKASRKWRDTCRGFYTGTLGSIGALNAYSGRRHYTMKMQLLESMVLALLEPKSEKTLHAFCHQDLFEDLGLVIDRDSAIKSDALGNLDRSDFKANEEFLARSLRALGMLRDYSDMTRMVVGEVN